MEISKCIQIGVFATEIVEHVFVRSTEFVDIGFAKRRARELDVSTGPVGGDIESVPLQERVSFHASVLIRRTHHCMSHLHLLLLLPLLRSLALIRFTRLIAG